MGMTYRNPFLEYDPEDPYREYEQEDDLSSIGRRTSRGQAGHDPGMWLQPNQTHMLERKGGGGFSLGPDPEKTQGEIKTVEPAGVEAKNATVSKLIEARRDAAQWGTEDPDSDRMLPQDIDTSNKGAMDSSAKPAEKPPGPDSPSTQYKESMDKLKSKLERNQAAYDKDFGEGKTHKWYSLESTEAWERRRAAQQNDIVRTQAEMSDMEQRFLSTQPRAAGGSQIVRVGGKSKLVLPMTDGSYKTVLDGLDDEAEKPSFGETVYTAADGRQYKVEKGGVNTKFLPNPEAGQPMPNGTQGPQGPHMSRWVAPAKPQRVEYGDLVGPNGEVIYEGADRPVRASGGRGSAKAPISLEEEALKHAEDRWKTHGKGKEFDALEPETQAAMEEEFIEREKQAYIRRRQGKGDAPKSATGKKRQAVSID